MIVAFCTKDSGVVFYFSILYFFPSGCIFAALLFMSCLFVSFVIFFFILPYFSSSIIKDFWGGMGEMEKKRGCDSGSWNWTVGKDVAWDFQPVFSFFSLVHCIFGC